MKTKILITGIAGFIGSNLADRLLSEGYSVRGIDNLSYGVKEQIPEGVDFYQMDIRDRAIYPLFRDVDYVFHLAAKNSIIDCQNDPVETADINVRGTVNVFEASNRAGVNKVIYAESSAMYEGSTLLPTPESEVKPESFYALSKFSSMHFAEAYSRFFGNAQSPPVSGSPGHPVTRSQSPLNTQSQSRRKGITFTALRYFCVYGPRQDYRRTIPPVFSAFIIKLLRGEQPVIFGTGEKRRDFIHVDDVNDFHLLCMKDGRTKGKVFNLGSGRNYSINDIYKTIARLLDSSVKPIYKPNQPGEAFANLADITEVKKLGWYPKIALEEGLLSAINYIRDKVL